MIPKREEIIRLWNARKRLHHRIPIERMDHILGEKQDDIEEELGYHIDTTQDMVGTEGRWEPDFDPPIQRRKSTVLVPVFRIPRLPEGYVIDTVELVFYVTQYRSHIKEYFTLDTYLITQEDPTNTHLDFYYSDDSDSETNPDTIFITSVEGIIDDLWDGEKRDLDPPLEVRRTLQGDSFDWFKDVANVGNNEPTQPLVYFRLNRSIPDVDDGDDPVLSGKALNRFRVSLDPNDFYLCITIKHKDS